MFEETSDPFTQPKAQDNQRSHELLPERYHAEKWFLELTFRQAAITITTYHCARGDCGGGRDIPRQFIEDDRHDEETRFILRAFLNGRPCAS